MITLNSNYLNTECSRSKNITFGAVHPVRYFIKCEDGSFHKVIESSCVKSLQRKLIGWLNQSLIAQNKISQGAVVKRVKNVSSEQKSLSDRFVRFITANDGDYAANKVARSFYTENSLKEAQSYIITGDTSQMVDEAAKPIGRARRDIKGKRDIIKHFYGISENEARSYVPHQDKQKEIQAVQDFNAIVKEIIHGILNKHDPKNSLLDVFFVPHINKGKSIDYEVVNAKFNRNI